MDSNCPGAALSIGKLSRDSFKFSPSPSALPLTLIRIAPVDPALS